MKMLRWFESDPRTLNSAKAEERRQPDHPWMGRKYASESITQTVKNQPYIFPPFDGEQYIRIDE